MKRKIHSLLLNARNILLIFIINKISVLNYILFNAKFEKLQDSKEDPPYRAKEKQAAPITSIYVTNLPLDITKEELEQYFSKCGIIMEDLMNGVYVWPFFVYELEQYKLTDFEHLFSQTKGGPRIKIYMDPTSSKPKGDALITYFKPESVALAINLLDESEIRPKKTISVTKAEFQPKAKTKLVHGDGNADANKKKNTGNDVNAGEKKSIITSDQKKALKTKRNQITK